MTKKQKIEAYSMYLDGATYQEIADRFGVSKQCIHQMILRGRTETHRKYQKYIYPNIVDYLHTNKMTVKNLAESAGVINQSLSRLLMGSNYSKAMIDAILSATGMTYEFAFAKEAPNEKEIAPV